MTCLRLPAAALTVAVLAAVLGSAGPALAFTPREATLAQEIPIPSSERAARAELQPTDDPRITDFAARFGGRWSVDWNEATGTPGMILGSGTPLTGPVASRESALASARDVVAANPALFGTTLADLEVGTVEHARGKWSVLFVQRYQGLRVEHGRAHVVITDQGRLMALGSDIYPVKGISTVPSVTREQALSLAAVPVGYDGTGDELLDMTLVVLPLDLPQGLELRLAYRVRLRIDEPLGLWKIYVDAASGAILGRENEIRTATVTGTVDAQVQYVGYCDGVSTLPMKNMTVTAVGQGSANTDASGAWSITVSGSGPYTIQAEMKGPYVDVNVYGTPPDATYSGSASPGSPLAIHWTDSNARHDERDCFYNVNLIHDKIKAIDPSFTSLDYRMTTTVGRTDGYCPGNAWWDGSGVNFCDPGSGYANTGEIGNVVYHEYGHGITQYMYVSVGDPPSDIHEGNSDVIGCYLEDVSIVGLGFYQGNCAAGIRNLSNSLQYPEDLTGEGHYDGQIIGGFHWDTREYLKAALGQPAADSVAYDIWHFGRKLGLPDNQPDQVYWTFVADDDDGNLDNGTPHHAYLCQAATNHGFSCPEILTGVLISHVPLATTTDPYRIHQVVATITSTQGAIDADSTLVFYRTDGGSFNSVLLVYNEFLERYQGTIPFQPQGSEVEYYILGVDVLGNRRTSPASAPATLHAFDVAYLYDPLEVSSGWTAGVTGDDATTGMWERADPQGTAAQPEDDHTPNGVYCYVTGPLAGSGLGDYDVDTGRTTLLSPVYNLSGGDSVRIKYFRWFTNDTGSNPGTDFWVVDISNDGGENYVNLENTSVSDHYWREIEVPLALYFLTPGQLRMRFIASDYAPGALVEAGVDDMEVLADFGVGTAIPVAGVQLGVPARYALWPNSPNPFNPQTTIKYDLPRESRISLRVFDVQGRVVRNLVATTQAAGHYGVIWDGLDEGGQSVASGVYFCRMEADEFSQTQKMILTK